MPVNRTLNGKAPEPKQVFVTGITGKQGGAIARLLLERGHGVQGLTRKPDGPAAQELRRLGAVIRAGDLEEPESLRKAAEGADAALVVATPFERGPEAETKDATNAMDAALAASVPHIVYSSVSDADRKTGIPHFDSKAKAEHHLERLGVDHTIVAPVFFMDNFTSPYMAPGLAKGVLAMALPGTRQLQGVAVRDLARFATLALEHPKEFRGKRVNIAGDDLPPNDIAAAIGAAAGRKIGFQQVPLEQVRQQSEDSAKMFEWFDRVGYGADIPALRREYPEVGWLGYRDWAAQQAWATILAPSSAARR